MSFMKPIKDQSANYDTKDSIIFHECKDDDNRESNKKYQDSESAMESSIDKCIENPTSGMSIDEDLNDFSEMNEHTNENETVTLVYQHEGMTLLSAGEDRLVNLVELSGIEGGTSPLDLDPDNLEYGSTGVILQQDFNTNGDIAVVTTDMTDSQLELLQSRLQGNETLTLFQSDSNLIGKDKVNDSPIDNHLIHIPTSDVLESNSIPLSLVSDSKGVRVLQNLDQHFITVEYDNGESLLPITLTSEDILASDGSTYSSSRRNSEILARTVSEENILHNENLTKDPLQVKRTCRFSRSQSKGKVGRPKKHILKTIGSGPNAISSEGVVQQINNRLVTFLPRPEDLKKLMASKQLVALKTHRRPNPIAKINKAAPPEDKLFPDVKENMPNADELETMQIYVDLAAAQESKSFCNLKPTQMKAKKKRSKNSAVVISSTGRKPRRSRKVQTSTTGAKGPKIIHTGPATDRTDSRIRNAHQMEHFEGDMFKSQELEHDNCKETEFDFFNNVDLLKKKLPPRKRGMRYQKMIEELKKSDGGDDSLSEDDESPDFLTNKSLKPKISTGKRGRPRKHPIKDSEVNVENGGTRIIQLGENLTPIKTSTSASVLVKEGMDNVEDKPTIETQNNLIITFDHPIKEVDMTDNTQKNDPSSMQSDIHIDQETNISLVPQYDAVLESSTIFVKEDGCYEEGFTCEYCLSTFEFKRQFLKHLKTKHDKTPLDCGECGKTFTSPLSLRSHEAIHRLENSYNCDVCSRDFFSFADLKEHQAIHCDEFVCQLCADKFSTEESYKNHVAECTSEQVCKMCLETYDSLYQLEMHNCQGTAKRYLCDICNAYFVGASGLNRHRKIHTRSNVELGKGVKCFLCLANFSYQETLDIHLQTVHGHQDPNPQSEQGGNSKIVSQYRHGYAPRTSELYDVPSAKEVRDQNATQPFLCGICDEAFSDIDQLCDHFNACHTGEQPMFCDVCSVGCVTEAQLISHMKIHALEEVMAAEHCAPTEEYPFVCKLCPKRFRKENEVAKHTKLHTEEKKFKCDQCLASFMIKSTLDKHLLVHSGQRPYVCDICFKGFRQIAALVRHKLWTHRLKNKNKCEICCKVFFSQSLLLFHLDSHGVLGTAAKERIQMQSAEGNGVDGDQEGTDATTCEFCGTECTSVAELAVHKLSHSESMAAFACNVCQRSFKDKRKLKKHRLKHRLKHKNVKTWACDICDKSFATKLTRVRHSHVHLREALNPIPKILPRQESDGVISSFSRDLVCQECNIRFQHKSHFVRHKLLHAGIPLFKCGICGKMFVHKSDIFRHKVMHSFMFFCDICGKNFHKRSLFELHTKKHLYNRPFKCETCDKRFTTNSGYTTHMLLHSGLKPYKCNYCSYSCTQSGRLAKHRQSHLGVKLFSCDVCNKQLATNESLKIHSRIHTGERPHKCPDCPKSFVNKGSLTVHAREHFRNNSFKCDSCPHQFKKEPHLAKHKLFHQIQQQYTGNLPSNEVYSEYLGTLLCMCDICGRVFNKKKYLHNHQNAHAPSRKFVCTFCSKVLISKLALKNHLLIHSGEMPHKCSLCSRQFRNASNLKRHERFHAQKASFRCEECSATFTERHMLEEHRRIHMNLIMMDSVNSSVAQQLYVFDSVEESMNDAMNNTQQLLVDNVQQQFIVDGSQSLIVFPENSGAYAQIPETSNAYAEMADGTSAYAELPESTNGYAEMPEPSNIYADITDDPNAYPEMPEPETTLIGPSNGDMQPLSPRDTEVIQSVTQMKAIADEGEEKCVLKPHQCDVCFKTFAKRQYLTKHKYRHRDVKAHPCDVCGKRFAQKFEVAVHKMKHTGQKPYRCDQCGKDFRSKANLINHKMKHSGEYPFMCSICNKGLSTQLQLERHVSWHTGTYPYKCDVCQKGFSMRSSVAKHYEKLHLLPMGTESSQVDSNMETMPAISGLICKDNIKREFPIENELSDTEPFSVRVQPQYLKGCLLSDTSMIESKFLSSILQPGEPSGDVIMRDLSDN